MRPKRKIGSGKEKRMRQGAPPEELKKTKYVCSHKHMTRQKKKTGGRKEKSGVVKKNDSTWYIILKGCVVGPQNALRIK